MNLLLPIKTTPSVSQQMDSSDYSVLLDQRLEAPLWPEPVRVIRIETWGSAYELYALGLETQKNYNCMLEPSQMQELLAQCLPQQGFDGDAELFALGIEAYRIRLGYTFDPFFAVWSSRVDPLPHQLEAVYGVLLKRSRVRFLLADDPGAGKTIMAGLFLKELKYRGVAQRILIVTPANLTDQWRRELAEKFNEKFIVVDRHTSSAHYQENVWQKYPHIVTSLDFAKQETYRSELQQSQWDVVIVDEAHKLSATRYGTEVRKSLRYRLGEVLSQISTHLLFLTATPHPGNDDRFRLLLNLLDPDLFATNQLLQEAVQAGENLLFLRRLKEDMVDFQGKPLFPPRYVHTPSFELSAPEQELYNAVTTYVREHFKRAWEEKQRTIGLAMSVLQRRLASSTYAISRSLENRWKRLRELREVVMRAPLTVDVEELEDIPERDRWQLEAELSEKVTLARNIHELEIEIRALEQLVQMARGLAQREQDTKFQELLKVLAKLKGEKLLVFTEHKDTLDFLVEALRKRGYSVTSIDGSMRLEDRVEREREFRDNAQVMVATEAAGEGINLQFCAVMVNYDLPWNPTRLEQRMGRVHRYGQRYEVNIYNLVAANTREGEVLKLLLAKLEAMRQELGSDRVYDVVGDLLEDISLEQLILEHLLGRRRLEEIQAMVESRLHPSRLNYIREITLEALAKREVDLSHLRQDLAQSQTQRLEPEYTERFFRRAMGYLGGEVRQQGDGLFSVRVPYELRKERNLPSNYPRVTFDPQMRPGKAYLDVELLTPGHPLFDTVVAEVLRLAEPHFQRGAIFAAPNVHRPFHLGYLVLGIRNGLGQVVSQRLVALADQGEGQVHSIPLAFLVDAVPAQVPVLPSAPQMGQQLRRWASEQLLPSYKMEVAKEQQREIDIRRKYGLRSLEHLIHESSKKLTELKVRAMTKGEDVRLPIQNEERRLQELQQRRQTLEKELARSQCLTADGITLLAQAYVIPSPATVDEDDPQVRQQVEQAAMQVAIAFEQQQGRNPYDVSQQNLGYDIESSGRCIEVKGRAGLGAVVLTANEWITAGRLGADYWLYVVTEALSQPKLHLIQNPAAKLKPGEEVDVVRYVIPMPEWQPWAQSAAFDVNNNKNS